jgi:hypothetical protein
VLQGIEINRKYNPNDNPIVHAAHDEDTSVSDGKHGLFLSLLRGSNVNKTEYIDKYLNMRHPSVSKENPDDPNYDITGTYKQFGMIYPTWPYPYWLNNIEMGFEFVYEFLRGTRLASTNQLNLCFDPIDHYIESTIKAYEYMDLAILANDPVTTTEGVFRFADTMMWYTPIFLSCELTTRFIELTVMSDVVNNLFNPFNFFLNILRN